MEGVEGLCLTRRTLRTRSERDRELLLKGELQMNRREFLGMGLMASAAADGDGELAQP